MKKQMTVHRMHEELLHFVTRCALSDKELNRLSGIIADLSQLAKIDKRAEKLYKEARSLAEREGKIRHESPRRIYGVLLEKLHSDRKLTKKEKAVFHAVANLLEAEH